MPELPEVETVCQGIKPALVGSKFLDVILNRSNLRWPLPSDMPKRLKFSLVKKVSRRGKYILIETDNLNTLIIHLGMTGRIIITKDELYQEDVGAFYHNTARNSKNLTKVWEKHDHVVFKFVNIEGKEQNLIYNDTRRFGAMDLVKSEAVLSHKWLRNLGPEPLSSEFSLNYLEKRLIRKKNTIKSALMSQEVVAGIGNIYASEILWKSRVSPLRLSDSLRRIEINRIIKETKNVLNNAILKGGSSLKDFKNTSGGMGYFQMHFSVYDREKESCKNKKCSNKIQRIIQSGRSSFFCNNCQH